MVHVELSLARGVHREKALDLTRLKFENRSRTTRARVLKSFAFFLENEGNFGGNQLPDGSIGLSPLRRRRTICPSVLPRAFARDSPDFAFFRHFRGFFRVLLLLKPLSRSRSVAGVHVCVSVCVCECVCCVLCCAFFVVKYEESE